MYLRHRKLPVPRTELLAEDTDSSSDNDSVGLRGESAATEYLLPETRMNGEGEAAWKSACSVAFSSLAEGR